MCTYRLIAWNFTRSFHFALARKTGNFLLDAKATFSHVYTRETWLKRLA